MTPTGAGITGFTDIQNLTGGSGIDNFTFNGAFQITGSINGEAGTSTIISPNLINAWTISGSKAGTLNPTGASGATSFSDITNITGGSNNDTITGPNAINAWTITGTNIGTLLDINFISIEKLVGGTDTDTFTFIGTPQISGIGGIGIDGNGGTNTIIGPDITNAWTITADDAGTLTPTGAGATVFTDIQNLTGGSGTDNFTFNGAFQVTAINGNVGTNTITGPNVTNAWVITADDAGTLTPTGAGATLFTDIQNLTGGSGTDNFTFNGAFQITGAIDGEAGTNTIIAPNVPNTWTISSSKAGMLNPTGASGTTSFSDITNITGGSNNDTIMGPNIVNAWTVSGIDTGTLLGIIFTNIEKLIGGTNTDTFTFIGISQISGIGGIGIDGNGGSNTITGPDITSAWAITDDDIGTLSPTGAGATVFTNIQNLTGGSGNDSFVFTDAKTISGKVNGGVGGINALDYNAYTTAISINLQTSAATGVFGGVANGFSNIDTFIGSSTSTNNTVTGTNGGDTWTFQGMVYNTFTVNSSSFSNFQYVIGGTGDDSFVFIKPIFSAEDVGMDGALNGGGGTNTLDHSLHLAPMFIDWANHAVTGVFDGKANGFSNITNFIGPGTATFYGPNLDCSYHVTSAGGGYINVSGIIDPITFDGIANIISGSQNDDFNFEAAGSLTGFLGGGLGSNTLNFVSKTAGVTVTLTGSNAGIVSDNIISAGFININSITGSAVGNNQFIFNIDGSLTGFVNGNSSNNNSIINAGIAGDRCIIDGKNTFNIGFITGNISNIQRITGSDSNDTFLFTGNGFLDFVDGGGGYNVLDLYNVEDYTQDIVYNVATRSGYVIGVVTNFQNIDMLIYPYAPSLKTGISDRITIETLQSQIFYEKDAYRNLKLLLLKQLLPKDYLRKRLIIRNIGKKNRTSKNEKEENKKQI